MENRFSTKIKYSLVLIGLTLASGLCLQNEVHAGPACQSHSGSVAETKILASPEFTFEVFRGRREHDPDGSRVISTDANEIVVEEIFDGLPVIGQTVCTYKENYENPKKVEFKMLHSDKLKAFQGEWTFEPADNGKSTLVKLRSFIDPGLKIPFAKQIAQMAGTSEVKKQLADFKCIVEAKQKRASLNQASL